MVLLSTDDYALCLLAFFAALDGYAQLKRPERPPAPDPRDGDETLQNLRSVAYEQAIERWKIEYLQPWEQRKERHDRQKRIERRKTLRNRTSEAAVVGDATAMQRLDSERDRKKKSMQSSRKRISEAAAAGDATAMQRQDSERDRIKKSMQSSRKRISEAAAAGDATAMQRQDSERDRKRHCRDEQRSIQSNGIAYHPLLIILVVYLL